MLEKQPDAVGWGLWYVVRNEAAERELIGLAGFKGKPVKGCCEMGYSLVPVHQGQGYGSEAARALVRWAFQHEEVNSVSAETLPDLIPSIRVMEKCGMKFVGAGKPEEGHGTVRYSISRAAYAASGRDSS
jgi:RimJ/RimL family protein N-acetyltransferase